VTTTKKKTTVPVRTLSVSGVSLDERAVVAMYAEVQALRAASEALLTQIPSALAAVASKTGSKSDVDLEPLHVATSWLRSALETDYALSTVSADEIAGDVKLLPRTFVAIHRPEDYADVCDDYVVEDFLSSAGSGSFLYDIVTAGNPTQPTLLDALRTVEKADELRALVEDAHEELKALALIPAPEFYQAGDHTAGIVCDAFRRFSNKVHAAHVAVSH